MTKQTWECWAYVSPPPEEKIRVPDSELDTAGKVWIWWHETPERIQAAKQRGARVIRVRLEEIEE